MLSPEYASSVALVLNLKTGHVSPQYHVIFDDTFSTVEYLRQDTHPTTDSHHIPTLFQEWTTNTTNAERHVSSTDSYDPLTINLDVAPLDGGTLA